MPQDFLLFLNSHLNIFIRLRLAGLEKGRVEKERKGSKGAKEKRRNWTVDNSRVAVSEFEFSLQVDRDCVGTKRESWKREVQLHTVIPILKNHRQL